MQNYAFSSKPPRKKQKFCKLSAKYPKSAKSQTEQVKICVICEICVTLTPRPSRSKKSVEICEICGSQYDVISAQDRIGLIRLTSVRNPSKVV